MQLNNKIIQNEFNNFLNSIQKDLNEDNNKKLISFSFNIPFLQLSSLTNVFNTGNYFYWKIKSENEEFIGVNSVLEINEFGEDRINKTALTINNIKNKFISNWDKFDLNNLPVVMGGNKFAPNQQSELWNDFSDADWFIPKYIFYNCRKGSFAVFNSFITLTDFETAKNDFGKFLEFIENIKIKADLNKNEFKDPVYSNSVDKWEGSVELALKRIKEGIFKKVVLSREVSLELKSNVNVEKIINDLGLRYPKCYIFVYKKNDSLFVGASPEKLAKFSNNQIEVDALAGSAPRGKTLEEDFEYENFLLNSKKNINEQEAVVSFIKELLEDITEDIYFEEKPVIRKLPNIQHLWTIITAKLKPDFNLLEVLNQLHPTPAICGTPWKTARDFILNIEPHDRGLYSGNIGWFNFNGNGEFAVAIRSALVKNKKLFAYAGCGIVEGSEANLEFEESEIKLKPILSLFVDEKVHQS